MLLAVNPKKTAGPDGVSCKVLRACAYQLAPTFTRIFDRFLAQTVTLPKSCLKSATIIPVLKKAPITSLNDSRPVVLTPVIIKSFERIVLQHIKNYLPPDFHPHQFAYRANRSTEDATDVSLHSMLNHLEQQPSYVQMLFVDCSSAFNTIIMDSLIIKLGIRGLPPFTCAWIKDHLTNGPQTVRLGPRLFSTRTLSIGSPQGRVLRSLLYCLYTHDCSSAHNNNLVVKFADDDAVVGLISKGDEAAYREEVLRLAAWCAENNLSPNTKKIKQIITNFRKHSINPAPLYINENITAVIKKAQQRLQFLRVLRKHNLNSNLLLTTESLLTYCITVWYGSCTVADGERLQRVVKVAQKIIGGSSQYGYGRNFRDVVEQEFSRTKGLTYLDHAAATLYPESLLRDYFQDISSNVYGNPHSHNPSSTLTHDTVERVRYRVLQHFSTTPEEYSVIFTSGCTAALRLVAESFPWSPQAEGEVGSYFSYLTDNHTSVIGMRGLTSALGVVALPVSAQELESRAKHVAQGEDVVCQTPHLFCYPAQSNFSGKKYPLSYVRGIQARRLYPACDHQGRWFVLLDAASHVSCSSLNLQDCPADFIPISFYKMFGFPTGLGALLVRNDTAGILKKTYFGGGTAAAYLSGEDYFVQAENISDRFEDGTVSFLDIIALNHGFESLYRITGSMHNIQQHTFGLARYTYMLLSSLCHGNRRPVAQIYTDGWFDSPITQGSILNFNLLDSNGQIIGYSQVDRMASLYNIHLRTGCFCNTGACQAFLGITNQQMRRNYQAGHVCGDSVDLVNGQPTGSVRVSFGYMSTFEDCQKFLNFVVECFVEKPATVDHVKLQKLRTAEATPEGSDKRPSGEKTVHTVETVNGEMHKTVEEKVTEESPKASGHRDSDSSEEAYVLTNIYIYPIKSCAAFEVHDWPVGPLGLLYDRGWMVVNGNGVCLSQKRETRLCLICPQVHLPSNKLFLQAAGMDTISVPLENDTRLQSSSRVCHSKVCGDRVETVDCGDEAASWLSDFLGQPCRLIRQSPDFTRVKKKRSDEAATSLFLSLVNEAQYLMINRASVALIQNLMSSRQDGCEGDELLVAQNVIRRFRANLVIAGVEPFEEDNWSHLIIGNTRFVVAGQCGRCQMIGIDQDTGAKTKEPLMSLSAYRTGKVTFGVYLTHQTPQGSAVASVLSVGSPIQPEPRNNN
ncbi:molybdenum cofactor sulfurase [Xenentodon cancila]